MTYKEKYESMKLDDWRGRASIMNLFHVIMNTKSKWRIRSTASYFKVSIGLVSENLRLIANFDRVKNCRTRSEALVTLKNYK